MQQLVQQSVNHAN